MVAACGADREALRVGSETITRAELFDALDEQGQVIDGVASANAAAGYLTQQAQVLLVAGAADRAGIDAEVTAETLQQVLNDLVLAEVERREPDARALATAATVCSRHILVATEAEADDVLAELADGTDFAELAQQRSTDPGSGAAGGDLGCQAQGTFVPEFEAALADAGEGEVVGPVETQFGFHVIQRLAGADPDPGAVIEAGLPTAFPGEGEFQAWFDDQLHFDDVDVDPRYGTWDPVAVQVLPPSAG